MAHICPICGSDLQQPSARDASGRDAITFACPSCGRFALTGPLHESLPGLLASDPTASAKLGHVLRRSSENGEYAELNSDAAEVILKRPLPRPSEQADLLLRWLAKNAPGVGETVWVEPRIHGAIIGSGSPKGFGLVLNHLFDTGLVTGTQSGEIGAPGRAHATLSFAGWERYERLREGNAVYRRAFMAMKFGDRELDAILEEVFKPNARQAGFDLFKLDDIPRAGLIDDRLRVEIQASDFLVADLTHENLGAYWEAGYAEGLGKPVIYTCKKEKFEATRTHFDTNHHLTIRWDADSPEAAGAELKATIRATLPHLAILQDHAR